VTNTESLSVIAGKIRSLEKKTIANIIESGRLLQVAFDRFEHRERDEYHQWIESEIGSSPRQVARYRHVFEFSQICQNGKFGRRKIADLNISKSALYMLVDDQDVWPAELIKEVLKLATKSRVMPAQVNAIIAKHRAAPEPELDADTGDDAGTGRDGADAGAAEPEHDAGGAGADPGDETGDDAETDADVEHAKPDIDDALPTPNELSKALEIIRGHNEFPMAWHTVTRLIDAVGIQEIAETLRAVSAKYYGTDALTEKANRADAQSRLKTKTASKPAAKPAAAADLALDSAGPLQGIPDFLRVTSAAAEPAAATAEPSAEPDEDEADERADEERAQDDANEPRCVNAPQSIGAGKPRARAGKAVRQ
jgi:hypothetical protein